MINFSLHINKNNPLNCAVPAGDNCKMFPDIDHGGVIYSDLLITTGVIAMYVCEDGYSLHGQGKYECAVGGVWFGNDTGQLPTCEGILKSICVHLVLSFYTVTWSYFDGF